METTYHDSLTNVQVEETEMNNLGDKKNGGFFKTDSIYLNLMKTN